MEFFEDEALVFTRFLRGSIFLSFVLFVILFFLHLLIIVRECFTLEKGCKEVSLDEGAHFSKLLDSSGFCSWF